MDDTGEMLCPCGATVVYGLVDIDIGDDDSDVGQRVTHAMVLHTIPFCEDFMRRTGKEFVEWCAARQARA